jgi:hypothetical protein
LNVADDCDGLPVKAEAIESRLAESHYDRLPAFAVELVRRQVNVVVATSGTSSAVTAKLVEHGTKEQINGRK